MTQETVVACTVLYSNDEQDSKRSNACLASHECLACLQIAVAVGATVDRGRVAYGSAPCHCCGSVPFDLVIIIVLTFLPSVHQRPLPPTQCSFQNAFTSRHARLAHSGARKHCSSAVEQWL